MAKSPLACEARRTQKQKGFSFSESEMDVARQLIQLSGGSDDHHHNDDDNNNTSCAEGKVEQSKVGDATDASSTNTTTIGETFDVKEEEDGICWPRKRRFRSISHLYSSTKPVIVAIVNASRRKCAV
jgi:hypothetical protein